MFGINGLQKLVTSSGIPPESLHLILMQYRCITALLWGKGKVIPIQAMEALRVARG
jgi:hypothetical protein